MSTPVFCAVKETKGSLREELLTRGYVIAFFSGSGAQSGEADA